MAGATYVLDKTYKVVTAAGLGKFVAVKKGTNEGECDLSSASTAASLGITQEAQATQYENVAVRKYGISKFIGNGTIHVGDPLEVASAAGDLQAATLSAGSAAIHFILGTSESELTGSGQIGKIFLCPHFVSVPAS